jgi:hypothetical protein
MKWRTFDALYELDLHEASQTVKCSYRTKVENRVRTCLTPLLGEHSYKKCVGNVRCVRIKKSKKCSTGCGRKWTLHQWNLHSFFEAIIVQRINRPKKRSRWD